MRSRRTRDSSVPRSLRDRDDRQSLVESAVLAQRTRRSVEVRARVWAGWPMHEEPRARAQRRPVEAPDVARPHAAHDVARAVERHTQEARAIELAHGTFDAKEEHVAGSESRIRARRRGNHW